MAAAWAGWISDPTREKRRQTNWGAAQAAPFSIHAQIKRNFSAQACHVTSAWLARGGAANGKY
jgi:hypothetical protein